MHISGAEGLYEKKELAGVVDRYLRRALEHPRGNPDSISLTVEKIGQSPRQIPSLELKTAGTETVREARSFVRVMLRSLSISGAAIDRALSLLSRRSTMRGAALLDAVSGERLEPDRERGIRVSRLGLSRTAATALSKRLARVALDTETVREALVLASKVSACEAVVAEVCISDDPDYTTGYLASGEFGYIRVPHIKRMASNSGGRVFFIRAGSDRARITAYLEKTPVVVNALAPCHGLFSVDELIGHRNL